MSETPPPSDAKVGEQELIRINEDVFLRRTVPQDSEVMFALIDRNRDHLSQLGDETAKKYPTLEAVRQRNTTQSPDEKRFGIWDRGEFVGFVKVTKKEGDNWEIGYWLGSEHTGKGYMTKAVSALTQYAVDSLGARLIFAKVDNRNKPSIKVLEKSGYILRGANPEDPSEFIYDFVK